MKRSLFQSMLTILILLSFLTTSCEPQIEFRDFADYAIEMNPNSLTMTYIAAKDRKMVDTLPAKGNAIIYPASEVTFSYTLTNTTDKNYRFTVCLYLVDHGIIWRSPHPCFRGSVGHWFTFHDVLILEGVYKRARLLQGDVHWKIFSDSNSCIFMAWSNNSLIKAFVIV